MKKNKDLTDLHLDPPVSCGPKNQAKMLTITLRLLTYNPGRDQRTTVFNGTTRLDRSTGCTTVWVFKEMMFFFKKTKQIIYKIRYK